MHAQKNTEKFTKLGTWHKTQDSQHKIQEIMGLCDELFLRGLRPYGHRIGCMHIGQEDATLVCMSMLSFIASVYDMLSLSRRKMGTSPERNGIGQHF